MDAAREVACELLYQENDKRGLVYNKCTVLANGNIAMDIGDGYSMQFLPTRLDELIPYHWRYKLSSTSDSLFYARATVDGRDTLCHRLLTNAPDHLLVDHLNGPLVA